MQDAAEFEFFQVSILFIRPFLISLFHHCYSDQIDDESDLDEEASSATRLLHSSRHNTKYANRLVRHVCYHSREMSDLLTIKS